MFRMTVLTLACINTTKQWSDTEETAISVKQRRWWCTEKCTPAVKRTSRFNLTENWSEINFRRDACQNSFFKEYIGQKKDLPKDTEFFPNRSMSWTDGPDGSVPQLYLFVESIARCHESWWRNDITGSRSMVKEVKVNAHFYQFATHFVAKTFFFPTLKPNETILNIFLH